MQEQNDKQLIESYLSFLSNRDFPCVAAREAAAKEHVVCLVAGHMACPHDDGAILDFLYRFVDHYREQDNLFHSAAVIFRSPHIESEESFDRLMWNKLQTLADMDAQKYKYDKRVSADPSSGQFSFSLKEEAFFIVGLHPQSSRKMRRFDHPVLVFNPHAQFDQLRERGQYAKLKNIVRKRDLAYSGSVNPMLEDFGQSSEIYQYSGREYNSGWTCPLKIKHATN